VVALILAYVHITAVVAVALAVGGLAWILALSTLNSLYQLTLPGWVKALGMSFYRAALPVPVDSAPGSASGRGLAGASARGRR
jgi:hypothetical protein